MIGNTAVINKSSVFDTWYDCITTLYGVVVCDFSGSISAKDSPGDGYGGEAST